MSEFPKEFVLGGKQIGDGQPCFVVAEVAQAHDGSLGAAHAFVDAVAWAGADAIKFQTHIAEAESTPRETFRVAFSRQDNTRFDYWKRTGFSEEQWQGLAAHAREKGLVFLSSPFSLEAVDWLERIEVPAWKVGSGEVGNTVLLNRLIQSGRPILLSSGMSGWAELDAAVALVRTAGLPLLVYQCASLYPCPPEAVGLPLMEVLRKRYQAPAGLSDHSGLPYFGIAAAALGAASVEVHVAMSRQSFGPDTSASLVPEDLVEMIRGIRAVEASMRVLPDKDRMEKEMTGLRTLFGRSVVAARDLAAGAVLAEGDLAVKKPGGGLPPSELPKLMGRRLLHALKRDECVMAEGME